MKWFHRLLFLLAFTLVTITAMILSIQRLADGPVGPIPGAQFTSGTKVSGPITWSTIIGFNDQLELQLVSTQSSRVVGAIVHADSLYIPCDLGFIWNRFPSGVARWTLHAIYIFKDWNEHAMQDGRVIIRKNGMLYKRRLVRVIDNDKLSALRNSVVEGLNQIDLPVDELRALPSVGPHDIWFFRVTALGLARD
jgi:hypothetical protein